MASPFAVFRKYQAAFLVVFGVLIIVIFTIGDSLSKLSDSGGTEVKDPVVVRWQGTELTESDLQSLVQSRQITNFALSRVQDAAMQKGAFPQFRQQAAMRQRLGMPVSRPHMILSGSDLTPLGSVRSRILAEQATAQGVVIPDTRIQQYLELVSEGKLNWEEIREILRGGKNTKYPRSIKSLFAVIRQEMLAENLYASFYRGNLAMPAGQQFDYFARSKRQIEIDVLEIPVSDFTDEVAAPSERELNAYFEKYQYQTPVFDTIANVSYASAEPGFKLPHRISLAYVKVNVDEQIAKAIDTVTDAEIEEYYEANKRIDEQMHATADLTLPPVEGEATPSQEPPQQPANDSEEDAAKERAEEKAKPEPQESGRRSQRPIRFVGFQDSEEDAAEARVNEGVGEAAEPREENSSETVADSEGKQDGEQAAKEEPAEPKEPTYKPLDEVRDYIRQRIAEKKAGESIDAQFAAIRKKVTTFAAAQRVAEGRDDITITPPDVKQLAAGEGLEGGAYMLQSTWRLERDTQIGRSVQQIPRSQGRPFGDQIPYTDVVTQKGEQSLWQVVETVDQENNRFISWKTGEALSETPPLEGTTRDRVVLAWKEGAGRGDAEDTARKRAVAAATTLRDRLGAGETFDAIAAERPGGRRMATEAFSWLTSGSAPMMNPFAAPPLRLSQIDGIDQPGTEFMKVAFSLKKGQAGVAINHPQTHVYLIQVTFENKSQEVLEQDFLTSLDDPRTDREVQSAAQLDRQLLAARWFEAMDRSIDLVWLNPAARFSR